MNHRLIICLTLFLVLIIGCNTSSNYSFITGKIENAAGKTIYFEKLQPGKLPPIMVDSAKIDKNGHFAIKKPAGALSYYQLRVGPKIRGAQYVAPKNVMIMVTDSTEQITITSKIPYLFQNADIKGSKETAAMVKMLQLNDSIAKFAKAAQKAYLNDRDNFDSLAAMQRINNLNNKQKEFALQYIKKYPNRFTAMQAFSMIGQLQQDSIMKVVAENLNAKYPKNPFVNNFVQAVKKQTFLSAGTQAPDFTLYTMDKKTISLSDFRGQYVLIDFWASWCRPCRKNNPKLVAMYKRFHPKGLQIFGVSLDRSKEKWIQAIQQDNLLWKHGSDLKGWNSGTVRLYNISYIPYTVLVNPDGKILAKNPPHHQLINQLERIYN